MTSLLDQPNTENWESVIGLEVHVQLLTTSKLFSGASTAYGAPPNTQACAIDLGLPGVLPVLNQTAVIMAIKFGLSVDATIAHRSVFARKNYFYPDLPKGYQISQFDLPIVQQGYLSLLLDDQTTKKIGITRAHLEEDAGKSLHDILPNKTAIDLNRAGTPLLEIVSEPALSSAKEAVIYLKTLHALVCCLGICDGNMQEGSFRCDANVSVRKKGEKTLGTRTEIKNINSFKFVEKAINYEIARQIHLLENQQAIIQETRLYDANQNQTRSMRSKENANDYRYFPDPDLLPVVISQDLIDQIKQTLPELPQEATKRFQEKYQLTTDEASMLVSDKPLKHYFEKTACLVSPKLVANWILGELAGFLNKHHLSIQQCPISPSQLASVIQRIADHTISHNMGKQVFEQLWQANNPDLSADDIIQQQGLQQITDDHEINQIITQIISAHPVQVNDYRAGKDKLFGFFIGLAMKITHGKIHPEKLNHLLKIALSKR